MKIIKIVLEMFFIHIIFLACCKNGTDSARKADEFSIIYHAMGGLNNEIFLECKECFLKHYTSGGRLFEADIMKTTDEHVVLAHPGFGVTLPLSESFSLAQFLEVRPGKIFTPLDSKALAMLMNDFNDWSLIADTKFENLAALRLLCQELKEYNVDCTTRVIPYLVSLDEAKDLGAMGFKRAMFAFYRLREVDIKEILKIRSAYPIFAEASLPKEFVTSGYGATLLSYGIKVYVHTINSAETSKTFKLLGYSGVMSDFLEKADVQ